MRKKTLSHYPEPKKTIKAYKLVRTLKSQPGKIFPLFIAKSEEIPMGVWMVAKDSRTKGFAPRPGWHAGAAPSAPHLLRRDGTLDPSRVWVEVEIPADIDYTEEAQSTPTKDFRDKIPEGGFYRFSTQKEQGEHGWIIGGAVKVTKIMTPEEVSSYV